MSVEANKRVVRRLVEEVLDGGDVAPLEEIFAEDADYRGRSEELRGREGFQANVVRLHEAFEDVSVELEQMIAEDDRVAVLARLSGTQVGEWDTMPPSGRPVSSAFLAILELREGRITRYVEQRDDMSVWVQVGSVPAHLRRYLDSSG